MAKGKHAAALFEVIHADRRFGKKTPPSRVLSTPKWWFKGKSKTADAQAAAAAAASTAAPPPAAAAIADATADATADARPRVAASDPAAPIDYMPSVPGTADAASRPVNVKVNPDRQEISFRLTYTSAIVGGFALMVVLGLAYVIGRKMSRGPAAAVAAAASTEQIRKGKPQPGVLDLQTAARGLTSSIAPVAEEDESANVVDPAPLKPAPGAKPSPAQPAAPATVNDLVFNKQYVVVQSFPALEKAQADEAAKLLNEAGIGALVVKGLPGWPPTWYSVVGTRPFEQHATNTPEYQEYKKSIMEVSAKYAGKSKFKRFDPILKKWNGTAQPQ